MSDGVSPDVATVPRPGLESRLGSTSTAPSGFMSEAPGSVVQPEPLAPLVEVSSEPAPITAGGATPIASSPESVAPIVNQSAPSEVPQVTPRALTSEQMIPSQPSKIPDESVGEKLGGIWKKITGGNKSAQPQN